MVARLGGDEFAAILFQADESDGRIVTERILGALAAPRNGERPSLSVGIATGTAHADANEIRAADDEAMYRAKQPVADAMNWPRADDRSRRKLSSRRAVRRSTSTSRQ